MYEVQTKVLKQTAKRNISRYHKDFMFELTKNKFESLRSQIVTLKKKGRVQHRKSMPFSFKEQDVSMLTIVLKIVNKFRNLEINDRYRITKNGQFEYTIENMVSLT